MPREAIESNLSQYGMTADAIDQLIVAGSIKTVDELESRLGKDDPAVVELRELFELAEGYGYVDWLQLDTSVVRGLAYYTGTVFEAFDRAGTLRAICGGGRYDTLLSTYGGQDIPACGFGFGDVTIVELLKEKGCMPTLEQGIDDMVFAFGAGSVRRLPRLVRLCELKGAVSRSFWSLRKSSGPSRADRVGAKRMFLVAPDELEKGRSESRT